MKRGWRRLCFGSVIRERMTYLDALCMKMPLATLKASETTWYATHVLSTRRVIETPGDKTD
jgi:hypothetical protein